MLPSTAGGRPPSAPATAAKKAGPLEPGRIPESDWTKISATVGRLAEAPLYIDDNRHLTVMDMRAKCRRLKSQHGDLGLVVVDYLQLMSTGQRKRRTARSKSPSCRGA